MGMFSQIKGAVNSILPSLYEDKDLSTPVIWRTFASSIFNEELGINEEVYTNTPLVAIRIEKQTQGMTTGRSSNSMPFVVGDVIYMFKGPDIPVGASTRDIIVDGAYSYAIDKITPVFGLITKVEVRGYA